jgi:hypothetical protein
VDAAAGRASTGASSLEEATAAEAGGLGASGGAEPGADETAGSRSTLVRSRIRGRKAAAITPTTAMTAEIRKTRPISSPYTARTTDSIGAGNELSCNESLPEAAPGGTWMPAAANRAGISPATRSASTAPSTDTPIVPPSDRKNVTVLVAAPMSRNATVFCTAGRGCAAARSARAPSPPPPAPACAGNLVLEAAVVTGATPAGMSATAVMSPGSRAG